MTNQLHVVYVGGSARDDVVTAFRGVGATIDNVSTLEGCLSLEVPEDRTCIVTECTLPDETGASVCERISVAHPGVPLVVFTDDGSEMLAGDVVAAGADGYVPRSQGIETLVARVVELVVDQVRAHSDGDGDQRIAVSDTRYESLVEQSPLAIVEWNVAFEVVGWNPAATELFGYDAEEAIGNHAVGLVVPETRHEEVSEYFDDLVVRGEPHRTTSQNVRRDGSFVTCEWINTPLTDTDGTVVGFLSCAQDVSADHKRAEVLEALQETTHDMMLAETPTEIAELTVTAVDDAIGKPNASVRLYDETEDHLECVAVTERVEERQGTLAPIDSDGGPFWEVFDRQEPRVIDELTADSRSLEPGSTGENVVLYPLDEHGLLAVTSTSAEPFDETDVRTTYVLAATAKAALERASRQHELERAKMIVETVGDGVYSLDSDGYFHSVNDTLASITGYPREELVGGHISTVLSEESLEYGRHQIRSVLQSDDTVATYELPLERRDGERTTCEITMTVVRADGRFTGTVGTVRDISERTQMERELRERKQQTTTLHEVASRLEQCETERDLFEETVDAAKGVLNFDICVINRVQGGSVVTETASSNLREADFFECATMRTILETVSRTHQPSRIGDISAEELALWTDEATGTGESESENEDLREDEDSPGPEPETALELVAQEQPRASGTTTEHGDESGDKSGSESEIQSVLCVPIGGRTVFAAVSAECNAFDGHDQELAELLISNVSDALERMAFETQLREERDRFAALFENVPDAVVSVRHGEDDEPIIERINPAFEHVFGYEEAELLDESLDRFVVPSDRAAEADTINHRGSRGEIVEREVKRRTADGLRDFMMRVVPMEVGEEIDRSFGVYTDITEQKQRQKRVEILNRVLRHDLRNGMNIINGCAEMLTDVLEDEASRQYADTIQERAGELISLAEKTRAVERTLDRRNVATGPIDVVESVESALEAVDDEFDDTTITVSRSYSDEATIHARADDMLETAILHVVENAVHHNDMPTTALDVTLESDGDTIRLSIADNGPGIPTEEQELLLEEKEITQLRHASGLGLWLVNWVVTHSGGALSFAENEPRGTVVILEIPKAEVPGLGAVGDGATALE